MVAVHSPQPQSPARPQAPVGAEAPPATETNGWVYVTGRVPLAEPDEATGATGATATTAGLPADIEVQTRRTLDRLVRVLADLGLGLDDVVSVRCLLTHYYEDFARFNAVYGEYFGADRRPARTCTPASSLAHQGRVEIDLIARRR